MSAAHPLCDVLNVVPSWTMRDNQDTYVLRRAASIRGMESVEGVFVCVCGNKITAIEVHQIVPGTLRTVMLPSSPICTCCPAGIEMRYYGPGQ